MPAPGASRRVRPRPEYVPVENRQCLDCGAMFMAVKHGTTRFCNGCEKARIGRAVCTERGHDWIVAGHCVRCGERA